MSPRTTRARANPPPAEEQPDGTDTPQTAAQSRGNHASQTDQPRHGAYVKKPRDGDTALDKALFNVGYRAGFENNPPKWQQDLHDLITAGIRVVLESDLEEKQKVLFCEGYSILFTEACVRLPATQRAPAMASNVKGQIENLTGIVLRSLEGRIEHHLSKHLTWAICVAVACASLGSVLLYGAGVPTNVPLGCYLFGVMGAMLGIVLSDGVAIGFKIPAEYGDHMRRLRRPFSRICFTTACAIAALLLVSAGAISLKIGDWDSRAVTTHPYTAIGFGILAGIPSSAIGKRLFAFLGIRGGVSHPSGT